MMAVDDLWRLKDDTPSRRDGRGKRYRVRVEGYPSTLHRTRKEADLVNAERITAGPPTPKSTVTVNQLLDRWLAGKKGLSANGYAACQSAVRQVRPRWGRVLACDVTRQDVTEWLAGLQSRDIATPKTGDEVTMHPAAGSTKAKALRALAGALEIGVDTGAIGANPARKINPGKQAKRAVDVLTTAELKRLAAAAGKRDAGMMMLLGTCGLRISEACALNVGDVDLRRRRLVVREAKDAEPREVPIPETVLRMLALNNRDRTAPLFLSPKGKRVRVDNWRSRVFDPAKRVIGRPDITPHVLRHTAASLAIASGADVKAVQQMLGHSSAKMTLDTYAHLWDTGLDDVATRMDKLLGG